VRCPWSRVCDGTGSRCQAPIQGTPASGPAAPAAYSEAMHAHLHAHGGDGTDRARDRRALGIALGLILAFMAGEIVAALLAGSLALLADAGHMLTDAAALGGALVAARVATRPARGAWTFGFGRVEILAAQANGATLLVVALLIVYSAVRRLIAPPHVHGLVVLVVALVGVAVNLVATAALSRASRESLNVRGAFLHVATDLAAFVGTAAAGALVLATGWNRFDPIAGLLVAALMMRSSWSLLRESGRIFLEGSPAEIDPAEVAAALAGDGEVREVHDLHVWTVTSGFPALAAHVLVEPGADCHEARRRLERVLVTRFGLRHTTLQVDHVARRSQDVELGSLHPR
jgi:cobalt-zinc-cadmium efflux system protein